MRKRSYNGNGMMVHGTKGHLSRIRVSRGGTRL